MRAKNSLITFVIDAVAVLIFATIGRQSHERGLSVLGVLETATPFLVALALMSVVLWLLPGTRTRDSRALLPSGIAVWLVTVAGGLALRVAFGSTVAPTFQIVAAISLAVLLLGWRLVWHLMHRRRRLNGSPSVNS